MFDKKLLESAEFYERRYRNFATLVIVPVFLLLVFLVVFSVFAKRELTVKEAGQVVPRKVLTVVQSTSSNPIELNNLSEGKKVTPGDVLLTYKDDTGSASKALVNSQVQTASDRLAALNVYKMSVESDSDRFAQADEFGYSDMFDNYMAQVKALNSEFGQQVSDKQATDQQVNQQQGALQDANKQANDKITQYKAVEYAINRDNNSGLTDNPYAYLYDSYAAQIKGLPEADKNKTRQEMLMTINQSIEQLNATIENNNVQAQSFGKSADVSRLTTEAKIASLKSDQLASVTKEYADQKETVDKLDAQLKSLNSEISETTVSANTSGIMHVLTDKTNPKYLAKGTNIAEIYPDMSQNPAINVEFAVPADEVVGVKKRQKIRFRVNERISKPILINGVISNVDTSATNTKNGNVFKVVAQVRASSLEYAQLKYGTVGQVTVITGEKTWFNYVKDNLTKDE